MLSEMTAGEGGGGVHPIQYWKENSLVVNGNLPVY